MVLKHQPYHFDYWMLALARWQPKKSQLFPSEIPFWIRVLGVPMEFRTVPTFESIGNAIGKTVKVDLDLSRVQVVVDGFKELCFETTVDFTGGEFYDGEEVPVSLRYEKLFGYCQICSSLCHKDEKCPLDKKSVKQSPERNKETREGNGGWHEEMRHEDMARSYKGVVINGSANQHQKEREGRDYYGKGKGKMFQEPEFKWTKVAERGHKRSTHRGNYRGGGDTSRHRLSRKEDIRALAQQQPLNLPSEEAREEGEIMPVGEDPKTTPSKEFQEQLEKTQAAGNEVISDHVDVEKGLQMVKGLVEDQSATADDDVMDWDEIKAHFLEKGIDMDAAEDFNEDDEEGLMGQEEEKITQEEEVQRVEEDEKGAGAGEVVQKQGVRKKLSKLMVSTAASTKMRTANALVSPRKRTAVRISSRHGDISKQQERKGPSNPSSDHLKP